MSSPPPEVFLFYTGSMLRRSLPWAAAALLAGCATGGTPASSSLPPPEPVDLSLGILPIRPEEGLNETLAAQMRMAHLFSSVEAVRSPQAQDVDVLIAVVNNMGKLTLRPSTWFPDVTATSAFSRERLYSGKSRCEGRDQYCLNGEIIAADLARALGPSNPLYAGLAAQRARRLAKGRFPPALASPDGKPTAPPTPSSDVDVPRVRLPERPKDFALVVGIEKYSKIPEAKFAEKDAAAVSKHLEALGLPPRNIIQLIGSDATRSSLQGYLEEWLPKNVKPDSTVFFYFSGHGAPDPKTGEAYLVPWDGNASFLQSSAYPLKKLYKSLGDLNAKGVVIALDSCFSGAGGRSVLAEGARPLVIKLDESALPQQNLTLFTAASGDEITATLAEQGHGIFTYFFLKGLSGAGKDASGKVTAKSLYDYLRPHVQDEARRQNREQTPLLRGACPDCEIVRF